MAKVKQEPNGRWSFKCPGCGHRHDLPTDQNNRPAWTFNGKPDNPTFTPSILMRSGHIAESKGPEGCYYCEGEGKEFAKDGWLPCVLCHSFVTDGKIQFLDDCTHHLKGKTVPLEDII